MKSSELADAPLDGEDLHVLGRIATLYDTLDPVPDGLVDRIQFGITLDALHAEVAELQRAGDLVGVRSAEATEARTVTFASASLTVMITVTPTTLDRVRVDGWAAPGADVAVELHSSDGQHVAAADADGRFVFADVPRGLARLLLTPPAGSGLPPVVTPSVEI